MTSRNASSRSSCRGICSDDQGAAHLPRVLHDDLAQRSPSQEHSRCEPPTPAYAVGSRASSRSSNSIRRCTASRQKGRRCWRSVPTSRHQYHLVGTPAAGDFARPDTGIRARPARSAWESRCRSAGGRRATAWGGEAMKGQYLGRPANSPKVEHRPQRALTAYAQEITQTRSFASSAHHRGAIARSLVCLV